MADLLGKKGMAHEEYLVKLLKGAIPFDEGAILLFARATGLHFGVILGDKFWCTNYDNDSEKWCGLLLYAGSLKFVDTTAGSMDREDCYEILNLNAFGKPHGSANTPLLSPSHSCQSSVVETTDISVKSDSDEDYVPPSKRRRKKSNARVRELLATVRKPVAKRLHNKQTKRDKSTTETAKPVLSNVGDPPARCTRTAAKKKK